MRPSLHQPLGPVTVRRRSAAQGALTRRPTRDTVPAPSGNGQVDRFGVSASGLVRRPTGYLRAHKRLKRILFHSFTTPGSSPVKLW